MKGLAASDDAETVLLTELLVDHAQAVSRWRLKPMRNSTLAERPTYFRTLLASTAAISTCCMFLTAERFC